MGHLPAKSVLRVVNRPVPQKKTDHRGKWSGHPIRANANAARPSPPSLPSRVFLPARLVICIRANNLFVKFGDLRGGLLPDACPCACLPAECRVHRSITDEGHPVDALYYRAAYLFCHQHPFRRRYLNRRSSERGIRVPFPLIRRIRPTGRCPGGKPFCFSRWNNLRYRREIYT